MGYNSEVALALKYSIIPDSILDILVEYGEDIYYESHKDEHYILFYIGSVKWNDRGKTGSVIEWLTSIDEKDYRLVELGQESDDNNVSGDLHVFDLNYSRSIMHSGRDPFDVKDEFDNLKVDLNIPSKETIFRKIQNVHRAQVERQAQSSKESQPA